jgi:hypothetical protein
MTLNELTHTANKAKLTIESLLYQLHEARNIIGRYKDTFGRDLPAKDFDLPDSIIIGWHTDDDGKMVIDLVDAASLGCQSGYESLKMNAELLTK